MNDFKLGDVVVVPDKSKCGDGQPKTGTIIQKSGKEVLVLDSNGVIHQALTNEIYLEQK